jgi:hypothetical protein
MLWAKLPASKRQRLLHLLSQLLERQLTASNTKEVGYERSN